MSINQSKSFPTGIITFVLLLVIVFVVLKFAGFFPWSWWWVFSPYIFFSTIITGIGIVIAYLEVAESNPGDSGKGK